VANKQLVIPMERRERVGTTAARSLRASGKIPAILYGHGNQPQHVALDNRALEDLLHRGGRTGIVTLSLDGKQSETALLREIQRHPISRKILHADLQRVSATENVRTKVPIVPIGTPLGVKDFGGVMDLVVHELELEGPANELPDHVDVDVSELGIHEHATAGNIGIPSGFKLVTPGDTIVVSIEPSKTARQLEEAEFAATVEQPEPEVIGEAPPPPAEETPAPPSE
jgi:large subunit ribosomal protein L25